MTPAEPHRVLHAGAARVVITPPVGIRMCGYTVQEGVSRGIVRSHGGEVRLVRMAGGECRLEVELPVAPAQVAAEAGAGARPFTCLVVEPENAAREHTVTLLTNRGCRVIPAVSAEHGTELVQRLRFDLVFCAIRLPGLNWIEFAERVRPEAGAFVLLSEGIDFELSHGLLNTETHVLTKPVAEAELDQLLAAIETRLSRREGRPEAGPSRVLQIVRPEKRASSF